jgi:hypothetical protein
LAIGVAKGDVYVLWTVQHFSGLRAGTAETMFVHLPAGNPERVTDPIRLAIPEEYQLNYEQFPVGLQSGPRYRLDQLRGGGSSFVTEAQFGGGFADEIPLVTRARVDYIRWKTESQVNVTYLQGGRPTAYQLLSFTPSSSTRPSIASDPAGDLYLTWLERGDEPGWSIYMAGTAPEFQSGIGKMTWEDLARPTADTIFGLLSGAILLPFGLIWLIPSAIVLLAATQFLPGAEDLPNPTAILSLALTLLVYWLAKIGSLPGMTEYVPFSAWLPFLPARMNGLLQIGVPLSIAALGLGAGLVSLRRRGSSSTVALAAFYGLVDTLLTMAVYAVLVYAAY